MILHHLINVFIMTPAHVYIAQTAIGLINSIFRIVERVVVIGIFFEEFWVDDLVRIGTSNREGITHYSPLRFTKQAEYFSHVMHQAHQYHPIRMTISSDRFRGLKQMLELVKVSIRI